MRLSDERVWLFPIDEALRLSKQATPKLYWFVDPETVPAGALVEQQVQRYLIESMLGELSRSTR